MWNLSSLPPPLVMKKQFKGMVTESKHKEHYNIMKSLVGYFERKPVKIWNMNIPGTGRNYFFSLILSDSGRYRKWHTWLTGTIQHALSCRCVCGWRTRPGMQAGWQWRWLTLGGPARPMGGYGSSWGRSGRGQPRVHPTPSSSSSSTTTRLQSIHIISYNHTNV